MSDADNCLQGEPVPGPLPLGVAVIDSSVRLYGLVFPHVAHKHRLQMLEHFGECIKQAKASRQQAIQINIFTAVLYALKVKHLLLSSAPYYRFCFGHSLVLLHFVCSILPFLFRALVSVIAFRTFFARRPRTRHPGWLHGTVGGRTLLFERCTFPVLRSTCS